MKISASLEMLKNQGRSDVPLPVYPEVYPNAFHGLQDYAKGDMTAQLLRVEELNHDVQLVNLETSGVARHLLFI